MKKAILYSALALGSLTMASCGDSFLQIDPTGAVSEATLTNDDGIEFALTGAYSSLNGLLSSQWSAPAATIANPIWGDMLGGDTNEGTQMGDQPDWRNLQLYSIVSSNSYLLNKWSAVYEGVRRANQVMSMVQKGGSSIADADLIIAQAKFLKSVWMFEGIITFGAAIPYITVEDYDANVDPNVSNVDESGNYVYIWDKVAADLEDAVKGLPATWTGDGYGSGDYGRATKYMAEAVLGKLYLYWSSPYNGKNGTDASKLANAKACLEDVLNNGVDAKGQKYTLTPKYGDLYAAATSDWTGESVFDLQFTLDGSSIFTCAVYGGYYTGFANTGSSGIPGGWGFVQPTYNFVNSMMVDENGLPLDDFESKTAPTHYDGTNLVTDLTVAMDPRLDISMGRAGVPFLDWGSDPKAAWIRQIGTGGVYVTKKHQTRVSELGTYSLTNYATSNTKNHHVIRYSDIYLMLAEIAIRNNDLGTAKDYINKVRGRAANDYIKAEEGITDDTYTFTDNVNGTTHTDAAANYKIGLYSSFSNSDEAWKALKRERRAEFSFEGHRFFDLARWGDVAEELGNFVKFEKQYITSYTIQPSNYCTMPIPDSEITTAAGRLVQNADWKSDSK